MCSIIELVGEIEDYLIEKDIIPQNDIYYNYSIRVENNKLYLITYNYENQDNRFSNQSSRILCEKDQYIISMYLSSADLKQYIKRSTFWKIRQQKGRSSKGLHKACYKNIKNS